MLAGSLLAVGVGAAQAQVCLPNNPYDIINTSFHQSVAQRTDGGWAGWGQQLNKGSNALSPIDITSAAFANMGEPLRVTTASSTTNHQTIALTANGLYVWGAAGSSIVFGTPYLNAALSDGSVSKVKEFGSANEYGLPEGVLPDNVTMMTASNGVLALVAEIKVDGVDVSRAWVFSATSNAGRLLGDGKTGTGDGQWHLVKTAANTPLDKVKAIRVQNDGGANAGAVMVHDGDEVYAFGNSVYLGGGRKASRYMRPR